jgi:hypothetical protein
MPLCNTCTPIFNVKCLTNTPTAGFEVFVSGLIEGRKYFWRLEDGNGNIATGEFTYVLGAYSWLPLKITNADVPDGWFTTCNTIHFSLYYDNSFQQPVAFILSRWEDELQFEVICNKFFNGGNDVGVSPDDVGGSIAAGGGGSGVQAIVAGQGININAADPLNPIVTATGILLSLTTAERNALTPVAGQGIFNTTTNQVEYFNGTSWSSGVTGITAGDNITINNANPANPVISSSGIQTITAGVGLTVDPTDPENVIITADGVQGISAGTGIDVDATDPLNPIVSSTAVLSVVQGTGVLVDNTDPLNPVVSTAPIPPAPPAEGDTRWVPPPQPNPTNIAGKFQSYVGGAWVDTSPNLMQVLVAGNVPSANDTLRIGTNSGAGAPLAAASVMIGSTAGQNSTTANDSVMIGTGAGANAAIVTNGVAVGHHAGRQAQGASNVHIGFMAGDRTSPSNNVIAIGENAGGQVGADISGAVLIGSLLVRGA